MKEDLIRYARSLGFERVGVTSAAPLKKDEEFLKQWLSEGRAGEMDYLERKPELRSRPDELLPGAKSVIALAMSYYASPLPSPDSGEGGRRPDEGSISRYAWGKDYHKVLTKRLDSFVRYLESLSPGVECRTFVDTGPLLERALAQRAGLGFIGKNTMLITKGIGSWVFLASVVTSLELPADAPDDRSCGECRLCIDACPTQAITAPFTLDARRCISYLTIESDEAIPEELRPKMGGWIFGCDVCQDVCPHNTPNRHSPRSLAGNPFIDPRQKHSGMTTLGEILSLRNDEEFKVLFAGTPMTRAGRESLIRNACVAAANLGRKDLIPQLEHLARQDPHAVVREQAAWSLARLR